MRFQRNTKENPQRVKDVQDYQADERRKKEKDW